MQFLIEHTTMKFDIFTILSLILLAATVIYSVVRISSMKKKESSLEEELEDYGSES